MALNMWLDRDLVFMACVDLKKAFDTMSILSDTFLSSDVHFEEG